MKKQANEVTRTVGVRINSNDLEVFLKWVQENQFKLGAEVGKLISQAVKEIEAGRK